MNNNRKLIEEAATAILNSMGGIVPDELEQMHEEAARAALAVFEKAQGQPSDAQVEAALDAFRPWLNDGSGFPNIHRAIDRTHMRAALRAAGAVR